MSDKAKTELFKPADLQEFARNELGMELSRGDAERLTKVYCLAIRGYLATHRHKQAQPPFVVNDWREMSPMRRQLFGVPNEKRHGLTCGLHVIADNTEPEAYGVVHNITIEAIENAKKKRVIYRRFIFINPQIWRTVTATQEVTLAYTKTMLDGYKRYVTNKPSGDMTIGVDLSKMKRMVPRVKAKQLSILVQLVEDTWPLEATHLNAEVMPLRLLDIAHITSLFGDEGSITASRGEGFVVFFNDWITVAYELLTKG